MPKAERQSGAKEKRGLKEHDVLVTFTFPVMGGNRDEAEKAAEPLIDAIMQQFQTKFKMRFHSAKVADPKTGYFINH